MDEATQDLVEHAELVELQNGALADAKTGKIVRGAQLSSEEARELAKVRWAKYQQAIVDGVAEGAKVPTAAEGLRKIIAALTERALDPGNRHGVAAAREVLSRILDQTQPGDSSEEPKGIHLKADAESLKVLHAALQLAQQLRSEPEPAHLIEIEPEPDN